MYCGTACVAADEVTEVRTALEDHEAAFFGIFDFYASLAGVYNGELNLNPYTQLCDDCMLASKGSRFCRKADLDRAFIAADAASNKLTAESAAAQPSASRAPGGGKAAAGGGGSVASSPNRGKVLSIDEFMLCTVTISVMRYVLEGRLADVSDAVHALFSRDIVPHVSGAALLDANRFRSTHLYMEAVDTTLRRHEASLKVIFASIAEHRGPAKKLLCCDSWKAFLRAVELIGSDLSERDAALSFVWSRMAVSDPYSSRGAVKAMHLPFEGFLEALCRVAACKALPNDQMLADSGHGNAADFMHDLRKNRPAEYDAFVEGQRTPWGEAPRQPLDRAAHHLIILIIGLIEAGTRGDDDFELTEKEVGFFFAKAGAA